MGRALRLFSVERADVIFVTSVTFYEEQVGSYGVKIKKGYPHSESNLFDSPKNLN
jgi:hypothetical protein